MYSAEWCGVCKRAKSYFQENAIAFNEKDIDKSGAARREFAELGGRGVPLILVGKRKLSGFSAASFEKIYRP
jgi:glutaredoxin